MLSCDDILEAAPPAAGGWRGGPAAASINVYGSLMKDSAWVRLIIIIIKYDEEPKPHTKKLFSKKAKTTRQRFTHSASSGCAMQDALCVKRCLVVLAFFENIFLV